MIHQGKQNNLSQISFYQGSQPNLSLRKPLIAYYFERERINIGQEFRLDILALYMQHLNEYQ